MRIAGLAGSIGGLVLLLPTVEASPVLRSFGSRDAASILSTVGQFRGDLAALNASVRKRTPRNQLDGVSVTDDFLIRRALGGSRAVVAGHAFTSAGRRWSRSRRPGHRFAG
jgi:hypothetical protein